MELNWKNLKIIIFVIAIAAGCIIQVFIYQIEPGSGTSGFWLQSILNVAFYLPMIVILITFPRPTSLKKQLLIINILIFCLILMTMNVDYQVLRIFSLENSATGDLVWDKTNNLYWAAWGVQMSIAFLIFGMIYRLRTNNVWTAFRVGAVGPLMSFFSFEDIIYFPMHGIDPFTKGPWDWLPQHSIYFGHDISTMELIWIVSISVPIIFLFLILFAFKSKPKDNNNLESFPSTNEKRRFQWLLLLLPLCYVGFVILYLNTDIINNQIPFYTLLAFAGIIILFILFASYFPKIKSPVRQLVLIFCCYLIFWVAATEMDWHAVDGGFHLILAWSDSLWINMDYRMAMWLIFIPIILFVSSVMFKLVGNSTRATLHLSITNYLILFLGIDSIFIFLIAGGNFPTNWIWGNLHYSIFNGVYSFPLLVGIAIGLGVLIFYLYKKFPEEKLAE